MEKVCTGCYKNSNENGEHSAQWELIKWQGQQFASTIKKLWILILTLIILLFASNAIWIRYINQYDFSSETVTVEQDSTDGGNANYIAGNGDIANGETENYQKSEETH